MNYYASLKKKFIEKIKERWVIPLWTMQQTLV
jgi:hypothetical protein